MNSRLKAVTHNPQRITHNPRLDTRLFCDVYFS